ncbi:MAG TPA: hypothetical protein EYG51_21540, partial [Pseudomonadales bacterium]|nr:hypothetical protein [Pseudomonadales bacterium]
MEELGVFTNIEALEAFRGDISTLSLGDPNSIPPAITAAGLNPYRPDVIGALDFLALYDDQSEATINRRLLEIRRALTDLKVENVEDAVQAIKAEDIEGSFSILKESYEQEEENLGALIEALSEAFHMIQQAKLSLNLKNNTNLRGNIKHFFIDYLRFSEEGFNSFSNSKLLGQMVFELNRAMKTFSFPRWATPNPPDREEDLDFAAYRTITDPTVGSGVDLKLLARCDLEDRYAFDMWQERSPVNGNYALQLLSIAIAREFGGSVGISRLRNVGWAKRAGVVPASPGDPSSGLENLLGNAGSSIFAAKSPEDSLAWYLRRPATSLHESARADNPEALVLPFEIRTFRALVDEGRDPSTFLPGGNYLIDNFILRNTDDPFLVQPYVDFVEGFNRTVQRISQGVSAFTGLSPVIGKRQGEDDRTYWSNTILRRCLIEFNGLPDLLDSTTLLDTAESAFSIHAAMFRSADMSSRTELKFNLFRYFVMYDLMVQITASIDKITHWSGPIPQTEEAIGLQPGVLDLLNVNDDDMVDITKYTREQLERVYATSTVSPLAFRNDVYNILAILGKKVRDEFVGFSVGMADEDRAPPGSEEVTHMAGDRSR